MHTTSAASKVSRPQWPRQHAQLILLAGSETARAVLWDKVPADWRSMVQAHVALGEERIRQHVREQEKLRPVRPPYTPSFAEYREPVRMIGNPVVAAQHLAALRASIHNPPRAIQ